MPKLNTATVLDSGLERWLFKTARKNFWRVASFYELEDLVGDGYLVYAECAQRYKDRVTERRHFMALFRTCYLNHITDLANKRSREVSEFVVGSYTRSSERDDYLSNAARERATDSYEEFEELLPPTLPDAELSTLIQQAKGPVQLVLRLYYTEAGLERLREVPQEPRETINAYLCRVLFLDPKKYNLQELFTSFLAGRGMYYMRIRAA